jgi:hypothetical protein
LPYLLLVSFDILSKFFIPLFAILFRIGRISASLVSVPETTVHKYQQLVLGHDDVRPARQLSIMQSVAKSIRVQIASHLQLRLGIFPPDTRHHAGAGSAIDYVHHSW